MVFAGSCTVNAGTGNDVFNAFVEYELVPNLKHGDIVVMDNLSSHKNAEVIAMIHKAGAEVWFTPPYCPEFNPIEKAWGKLKDIIRRAHTLTRQAFDNPVAKAINPISNHDIKAWTQHAGDSVSYKPHAV